MFKKIALVAAVLVAMAGLTAIAPASAAAPANAAPEAAAAVANTGLWENTLMQGDTTNLATPGVGACRPLTAGIDPAPTFVTAFSAVNRDATLTVTLWSGTDCANTIGSVPVSTLAPAQADTGEIGGGVKNRLGMLGAKSISLAT